MPQNPLVVYQERLAAHQSAQRRHNLADARLSVSRLGVFALAVATAILVWRGDLALWTLAVPGICFLVLIVWHERVIRARQAVVRAIAHYERGLARIEDRWIGTGEPGTRFQDEHHPYAVDLDLFGPGSIFELLSTARTRDGEAALAGWLLTGAVRQ